MPRSVEDLEKELSAALSHSLAMSRELTQSQTVRASYRQYVHLLEEFAQAALYLVQVLDAGKPQEDARRRLAVAQLAIQDARSGKEG